METINSVYQWLAAAPVFIQIPVGLAIFWLISVILRAYIQSEKDEIEKRSGHRS